MPRFAILDHDFPFQHWDFLLEDGPSLRTWRLTREPQPAFVIPAEPLPKHRLTYLDYEGPVERGRGHVMRWDGGPFEWIVDTPAEVKVQLHGARVDGLIVVSRSADGDWSWLWS
jgi:hypothetical protein